MTTVAIGRKKKAPAGWAAWYARSRGCNKGWVSRLLDRGMPADDGDDPDGWTGRAADLWRQANQKEGVGHKSKGLHDDAAAAGLGLLSSPMAAQVRKVLEASVPVEGGAGEYDEGIDAMAARAREMERLAWEALKVAYSAARMELPDSGDGAALESVTAARMQAAASLPGLLRTFTAAQMARLDVEGRVTEEMQKRGVLVQVDDVWQLVQRAMKPVVDGLRQLPRIVGARANPGNPGVAESAVTEAVNVILASAEAVAKGGVK